MFCPNCGCLTLGMVRAFTNSQSCRGVIMKWISVKDLLPEEYERVVIMMWAHNTRPDPMIDFITPRNFRTAMGEDITYTVWANAPYEVTHWCGLPEFDD